jgi:hypothetical protein
LRPKSPPSWSRSSVSTAKERAARYSSRSQVRISAKWAPLVGRLTLACTTADQTFSFVPGQAAN